MRRIWRIAALLCALSSAAWAQGPGLGYGGPGAVPPDAPFAATGSTTARTRADRAADVIHSADGASPTAGMACDGTTDDRAALQALVTLAQSSGKTLLLQAGTCVIDTTTTGILITKPVAIRGAGMWGTILSLKSGSTKPMFTINVTTGTFAPGNGEPANVDLRDFTLTSPDRTNAAGLGVAHGLLLINTATHYHATRVYLANLLIGGVPGDGIHCGDTQGGGIGGFDGWVEAHGVIGQYTGGLVYYANSCTDGRWFGGEIAGAGGTNPGLQLAGTSAMIFDGVNFYTNGGYDINLFHADTTVFANCTIDLTSFANIAVNLNAGQRVDIISSVVRWASSQSNAFYGNIDVLNGNAGQIVLTADNFPTPASSASANKPKSNINFIAGSGGSVVIDGNTTFALGTLATTGVVTGTGTIIGGGPLNMSGYTVATLPTCNAALKNGIAYVTDATAPTYNAALTGGGAVGVPVFCSGAAWLSH